MSETVDARPPTPARPRTASGAAARSASRCPASAARARRQGRAGARPARSAASRCTGRTSSRATGACPRRRPRSSPPTAGSRPATSARIDADGYVTIVGRSKDLIISGGYNVYPAEIEGFINEMPGVAESAVIGVPHADFGEAVVAVVVRQAGRVARRRGADRRAEVEDRQLQGAQASVRRRRTAAQRDGQGAEEPAARAAHARSSMPDSSAAARPNAGCPRCGGAFHCGANEASCDCAQIDLDDAMLVALRETFAGCLCLRCLREVAHDRSPRSLSS